MKRFAIPILALLALVGSAFASEPTANDLLTKANIAATSEHKQILVIFHASWCGWCKKLDEFLADPQMGKLMTDNFVIVHVDVMENGDKKAIENAGGEDLMKQWNGEKAGLPFMVIQNASGKIVADSNLTGKDGSNIGYPAKPEEIAHFMKMLKSTNNLTDDQRSQIQKWLTDHAPKSG